MKKLYEKKPEFRPLCHFLTIGLGASIYQKFPDYEKLSYSPISVTCNYGFYQKYPHSLLLATEDIKKAQKFCEYAGKELSSDVPGVESECFRGIGRGLPFVDKSIWGDARKMAKLAVDTCKSISPNESDYKNCLSGTFNMLGREQVKKNYGISVNESDPMWLCREQSEEIRPYCWGNFKWVDTPEIKEDKNVSAAMLETIKKYENDERVGASIIWTIGYEEGRKSVGENNSYDGIIRLCSNLPISFQAPCISGFSVGLAKHSFPNRQHEAVLNFCQQVRDFEFLKNINCASQAIEYLKGFYSPSQFKKMCTLLKIKLGISCAVKVSLSFEQL